MEELCKAREILNKSTSDHGKREIKVQVIQSWGWGRYCSKSQNLGVKHGEGSIDMNLQRLTTEEKNPEKEEEVRNMVPIERKKQITEGHQNYLIFIQIRIQHKIQIHSYACYSFCPNFAYQSILRKFTDVFMFSNILKRKDVY